MRQNHRRAGDVSINMAPMIDVVFQLIIFFTLVSTFASAENIRMELPAPEKSQAQNLKIVDRVLINCQMDGAPAGGGDAGVLYSAGANPPEALAVIAQRVAAAHQANPKLKVIIRADKRLRYEQVREVMEVVAAQGIEDLSLVAHVSAGEEE